jgi:cytochrome c oxidase subunit I+III
LPIPSRCSIVCLLVVCFMIFQMAVFGYLFLYGIHPSFWTMPTDRWWTWPVAGIYGVGAALVLLGWRLLARERSTNWSPIAVCCSVAGR